MFAGVVAEAYIQGRTRRREISWERGWGWGKGADKGPNHNKKIPYNKHLPIHAAISDR